MAKQTIGGRGRMKKKKIFFGIKNQKEKKSNFINGLRRSKYLYLMMLLPMLYYIIFKYVPMGGILVAFKDFKIIEGIWKSPWVGLIHFKKFLNDPYFWKVVKNTILLGVYTILWTFPAPIMLALSINSITNKHAKKFIQSASYFPHFISTVVVCGMLTTFLNMDGPVNNMLSNFGFEKTHFITYSEWFRTIYITSELWSHMGWNSIIYLAALTGIDMQLYEAARVDGAGRWKQMVHITLPCLSPTITILLILSVGRVMKVSFQKVLLLYKPSTYEVADVLQTYVYRRGLLFGDFSYATGVGMFSAVIALLFLVTANNISRKLGDTSLW